MASVTCVLGWLRAAVVVTLVSVGMWGGVLPVQGCVVSVGGVGGFSSFIVLLRSSVLVVFGRQLSGVGAGVLCGGYGSDHCESVSSNLLSAKSCLCW